MSLSQQHKMGLVMWASHTSNILILKKPESINWQAKNMMNDSKRCHFLQRSLTYVNATASRDKKDLCIFSIMQILVACYITLANYFETSHFSPPKPV